jgi:hypothetical protein
VDRCVDSCREGAASLSKVNDELTGCPPFLPYAHSAYTDNRPVSRATRPPVDRRGVPCPGAARAARVRRARGGDHPRHVRERRDGLARAQG